jgi:hypothetical protein
VYCCFANTVVVTIVMMVLMAEREKRKRTTNIKENFTIHLSKQHKTKWEIYQGLQNEEQTHFFIREEKPEAVAMRSFIRGLRGIQRRIDALRDNSITK